VSLWDLWPSVPKKAPRRTASGSLPHWLTLACHTTDILAKKINAVGGEAFKAQAQGLRKKQTELQIAKACR